MKHLIWILLVSAMFVACENSDKKTTGGELTSEQKLKALEDSSKFTSIQWMDSTSLNLGQVTKGKLVEVSYRFKNSGSNQLIIQNVTAGCGCTVPEVPQKPYSPGEEGVIKAMFDSKNQHAGPHSKYVTVVANTNPTTHSLTFNVEITE